MLLSRLTKVNVLDTWVPRARLAHAICGSFLASQMARTVSARQLCRRGRGGACHCDSSAYLVSQAAQAQLESAGRRVRPRVDGAVRLDGRGCMAGPARYGHPASGGKGGPVRAQTA